MSGSDALALFVRERVEHAVVGVHGRQAVLGQLTLDDLHQLLHAAVVVRPVTHNLWGQTQAACHSNVITNYMLDL